jgi:hypothetical protein
MNTLYNNKISLILPEITDYQIDDKIWENVDNGKMDCIGSKNPFMMCFNYALKNNDLESCEDAFELLKKEYIPILKQEAKIGDVISFHKTDNFWGERITAENSQHFAIISDIKINLRTGKKIIYIKSKFGADEVFAGAINMLPISYGNRFIIWRKSVKKTFVK